MATASALAVRRVGADSSLSIDGLLCTETQLAPSSARRYDCVKTAAVGSSSHPFSQTVDGQPDLLACLQVESDSKPRLSEMRIGVLQAAPPMCRWLA